MKVLYIVTAFPRHERDVITPWFWKLLKELQSLGVEPEILASSYKGMQDGAMWGMQVYRWRYAPRPMEVLSHDLAIFEKLRLSPWTYTLVPSFLVGGVLKAWKLRARKYDLIHVSWPIPLGLLALPFNKVPWVFTFHHSELTIVDRYPWVKRLFGFILKKAKVITVNSNFTKAELLSRFPNLGRIEVIPWPPAWEAPKDLPPRTPHKVLFVGRLVKWKGVHYLLKAFAKLLGSVPDARLVIVGDGPEKNRLMQEASLLRLSEMVEFKGWKRGEELMREYAEAKVLVVPSIVDEKGQTESLGVVAIEALAVGTPVIASEVGGLPDVVENGRCGFLVRPASSEDLALKIATLLKDEALWKKFSHNAKERFLQRFSPSALARQMLSVYEEVVTSK